MNENLKIAVIEGKRDEVRQFLSIGANPNARDDVSIVLVLHVINSYIECILARTYVDVFCCYEISTEYITIID